MSSIVTSRIPKELLEKIMLLAKEAKVDRSTIIRKILERGLREELIEYAIRKIQSGELTLWKAAELINISLWDLIDEIRKRKVILYDIEDALNDLEAIENL
ncbi:MAG: UPF0175 family protein [Candidatus Njordarchaeia archaeon]|nr:UPF0175 family protein [Candidatus Korarchaeota archaeon]